MGSVIKYDTVDSEGNEYTEYCQIDYIPSDPACKTVRLIDGKVVYGPLLCWQIYTTVQPDIEWNAFPSPVTPDGAEDDVYVLFPDGTVRLWDAVYASIDEWKARQEEREAEIAKPDGE